MNNLSLFKFALIFLFNLPVKFLFKNVEAETENLTRLHRFVFDSGIKFSSPLSELIKQKKNKDKQTVHRGAK